MIDSSKPRVTLGAKVPMRDGVSLATTILLPPQGDSFPVLLVRTPYNRIGLAGWAGQFNAQGIALVAQDCRGRYGSEGEFYPWTKPTTGAPDHTGQAWTDQTFATPMCSESLGLYCFQVE
jgi:predicted acyl esterase